MPTPTETLQPERFDNFQRYLAAKRSVDDHALNAAVWQTLQEALVHRAALGGAQPMRILEIGAGTGAMFERMCAAQRVSAYEYIAIDAEAENVRTALQQLPTWAAAQGLELRSHADGIYQLSIRHAEAGRHTLLHIAAQDLFAFLQDPAQAAQYDLLIAHAFLDLVDAQRVLPRLTRLLKPGGLVYFPINFDGATILQPTINPHFDAHIEARYHATMDERMVHGLPSGDSQTGRHLFGHLQAAGVQILNAGSSDWVVFARPAASGAVAYPADEAYFLHFIIDTMLGALAGEPEIDQSHFRRWIEERHAQIERGELVYIAHQLDFVGVIKGLTA